MRTSKAHNSAAQVEFREFERNLYRDELLRSLMVIFDATEETLYKAAYADAYLARRARGEEREYKVHMLNCAADKDSWRAEINKHQKRVAEVEDQLRKYSGFEYEVVELRKMNLALAAENKELRQWKEAQSLEESERTGPCSCSRDSNQWARVRRKELELLQNRSELVSLLEDFFGVPEYQVFVAAEKMSAKLEKLQNKLQRIYHERRDDH